MDVQPKPFWNTTLATVTAIGTLIGAVGGLIATVYAMGASEGGDAVSIAMQTPSAAPTAAPSTPTESATVRPVASPTPEVIELAPDADSWWGSPGSSSDDEDEPAGEAAYLYLDWGCSEDSRGNGSKRECGSGVIALYFDLIAVPPDAKIEEAILSLYSEDGGDETAVYSGRAASEWTEDGPAQAECDSSDQVAGETAEDEWTWDVTSLAQALHTGENEGFGLCLILKESADAVTFVSREGASAREPVLTVTYH